MKDLLLTLLFLYLLFLILLPSFLFMTLTAHSKRFAFQAALLRRSLRRPNHFGGQSLTFSIACGTGRGTELNKVSEQTVQVCHGLHTSYHMAMIEAIKEYSNRGWIVHPLTAYDDPGDSPGKRPMLRGWQLLKRTPDNIESFIKKGCNIGLVCGKVSDVTVLDLDSTLFFEDVFGDLEPETLISQRTPGRSHVYFKYNPRLPASKHHLLGMEIMSDGSNVVLPPSIHSSGDLYKWKDPGVQIAGMQEDVEKRLQQLFRTETELKQLMGLTRTCFRNAFRDKPDVHGADGRYFMVAICTELMSVGAKEHHLKLFSKLLFGRDYNESVTVTELSYIDPSKTWRCSTLREKLSEYVSAYCEKCKRYSRPAQLSTQAELRTVAMPENVMDFFRTISGDSKSPVIIVILNNETSNGSNPQEVQK